MESTRRLPLFSTLSSSALSFLNDNLATSQCIARATHLATELEAQCQSLDQSLVELNHSLESKLAAYASFSDRVNGLVGQVNVNLTDLKSATCSPSSCSGSFASSKNTYGVFLIIIIIIFILGTFTVFSLCEM